MWGTHADLGGIKGLPGKGRCAFNPSAGLARCDEAGVVSSAWDPSYTESPKWAASRMGNPEFVRSPSSRPSGGKLGACLSPSSPSDSETLSPRLSWTAWRPRSSPSRWTWVCVGGGGGIQKRCWGRDGRPSGQQTMGSGWDRPAAFPVGNGCVSARLSWGDSEGVVGADLSTSPSHDHQPTPPLQGCASSTPMLGDTTT